MVLAGKPGVGKSAFALHIAYQVANGGLVLGKFQSIKGKVLLIDEENSPALLRRRIHHFNLQLLDGVDAVILSGFRIDSKRCLETLREIASKYDLIILDNWTVLVKNVDENKGVLVGWLLNQLRRIANESDSCILLIHHLRKDSPFPLNEIDTLRGSSVLTSMPDVVMLLRHESATLERVLKIIKN